MALVRCTAAQNQGGRRVELGDVKSSTHEAVLYDSTKFTTAITDSTGGSAGSTLASTVGVYNLSFGPVLLAGITNADIVTDFLVGHKFKILAFDFYTIVAVTTGSKLSDINLEIGTTNITGGVISLTSALCTPKGVKVAGTAVTALNTGTASDVISIEAANTTAFVEGSGVFNIRIQNMDVADAFASLAAI